MTISHFLDGVESEHHDDILTRLECEMCSRLIIKRLWPTLEPYVRGMVEALMKTHEDSGLHDDPPYDAE